jgi:hypothetical protein
MAGGWSTQRVDDLDDINAWMAQRNANLALRQQAEAIGRDIWDQGTRDGQDVSAAQPSDVVALGADPSFYGAKIRASAGGGAWSGNALGLKKYGPFGQFWLGTTTPLKTAVSAELVGNNALTQRVADGEGPP